MRLVKNIFQVMMHSKLNWSFIKYDFVVCGLIFVPIAEIKTI